jgi:peroxiredoxin
MKLSFRSVTDGLLAVAAVVVAGVMVLQYIDRRAQLDPNATGYKVGDDIGVIEGLDFSTAPQTLLMYVRSTCGFCTKSMPFYQRLLEESRSSDVRIVAVGSEEQETINDYLVSHGVRVHGVVSVTAGAIRSPGTPTLILVNREGKVEKVWQGQLMRKAEEDAVVVALSRQ